MAKDYEIRILMPDDVGVPCEWAVWEWTGQVWVRVRSGSAETSNDAFVIAGKALVDYKEER